MVWQEDNTGMKGYVCPRLKTSSEYAECLFSLFLSVLLHRKHSIGYVERRHSKQVHHVYHSPIAVSKKKEKPSEKQG